MPQNPALTISRLSNDDGAPVLSWPGRKTSELVIEPRAPSVLQTWGEGEQAGRVVLGDNLEILAALEPGSARLIYLDPPFFSEQRYVFRTRAAGSWFRTPSFDDHWGGDLGEYLSFLEDRARLLSRVLSEDGSIYVHLDASASHYVKVLLDEILGASCFSRQIIWKIGWVSGFKSKARNWVRNHDVILYYSRPGAPFHRKLLPHPEGYERRSGERGEGRPIDDVWLDMPSIQLMSFSGEKTGWATQKNESLLQRIIEASSEPGDLVLDPFAGAGTTAIAAARLKRRFLTIDDSALAVHLTRRRLLETRQSGVVAPSRASAGKSAPSLFTVEGEQPPLSGPLVAEIWPTLAGSEVRLREVPMAKGPEGVEWHDRIDGWWVCRASEPTRPIWHVHRALGRQPSRVLLDSPPLTGVAPDERLIATAIDLAGGCYEGEVKRG